MNRLYRHLLLFLCLAHCSVQAEGLSGKRPNIIVILTDDQGHGDLGVHGNPILKTPNLDRMHAESARFTDFHVSPTCSPTRASLLTGRHEFKSGVTHTILERERLSLKSTTLAQLLKNSGYTTGIFGKWHLGDEAPYQPGQRGFDEVFIHGGGGIGQHYPGSCADAPVNTSYTDPLILHNGRFEETHGFCTDVFFQQTLGWLEKCKAADKPFFVWLATNAAHEPVQCPPQWSEPYDGKVDPKVAKFYGMIANIDANVGKLFQRLKELDLDRNTLVIFMNDNGGYGPATKIWNSGMFGAKGTADNGGTRATSFWHWPSQINAGDLPQLTAHIDVLPTLCELAGAKIPETVRKDLEGFSLVPLLAKPETQWQQDRLLFTHVGRWGGMKTGAEPEKYGSANSQCSVRWQNYLMVRHGEHWRLFDLASDPGQTHDLASSHGDIIARLDQSYDHWWTETLPYLENEAGYKTAPAIPPFFQIYKDQFGTLPENVKKADPHK